MKGATLPLCERVGDLQNFPILLQIDGGARIFALNFSQEFKIEKRTEHAIKEEEYYADFAQGVGLKGYSRHFLPYFAHKLQAALPAKDKFKKEDLQGSIDTVINYMARD